jgi:hypothetical protein
MLQESEVLLRVFVLVPIFEQVRLRIIRVEVLVVPPVLSNGDLDEVLATVFLVGELVDLFREAVCEVALVLSATCSIDLFGEQVV